MLDDVSARVLASRAVEIRGDSARFRHDARATFPSRDRMVEAQVLAYLRAIECPVLLLVGREGPFAKDQAYAKLLETRCQAVRSLTVRYLDGGHYLHLTHAEEIASEVGAFLAHDG